MSQQYESRHLRMAILFLPICSDCLFVLAWLPSFFLLYQVLTYITDIFSYLHSTCMPPVSHSNLKAANILLDEDLMPRICDCGLAVLKPLSSNSFKLKVYILLSYQNLRRQLQKLSFGKMDPTPLQKQTIKGTFFHLFSYLLQFKCMYT